MTEILTIDVVGKFGPKANDKWYGLKKPLKPTDFVAGQTYEVELEEWVSGSKSGENIVSAELQAAETPKPRPAPKAAPKTETKVQRESAMEVERDTVPTPKTYEENKNRRILVQGITQAMAQSPSLAGLPFTSVNDVVANIKEATRQLIEFVDQESK